MKNIQKVKRVQLKLDQKDDLVLFGLVSSEPDYKLSLTINRKLKIYLKNLLPLKISTETGSELLFSRFCAHDESTGTTYNLFSNRLGKSFLLKKLKNVDYLFLVHHPEDEDITGTITPRLREIESVNAVFNIDLNDLKDKNLQYLTI